MEDIEKVQDPTDMVPDEVKEKLDVRELADKTFLVAVAAGDTDWVDMLPSTIKAPLDFPDMVQEVGNIWGKLLHARVAIINGKNPAEFLARSTVEHMEDNANDIIADYFIGEMLGGVKPEIFSEEAYKEKKKQDKIKSDEEQAKQKQLEEEYKELNKDLPPEVMKEPPLTADE